MGKARWWVCDDCTSLNDLPANKCYNCRKPKPGDPKLFDDQYSQVGGGQQRVGITVDLSKAGDILQPDPLETADGGGIVEAFDTQADPYADVDRESSPSARYDPYTGGLEPQESRSAPKPLREPTRRGIDAIGGRQWTEELARPEVAEDATSARRQAPPPSEGAPPTPYSQGALPPQAPPPPPPGAPSVGAVPPSPGAGPLPGAAPRPGGPRPPMAPPPPGVPRPPAAPPPPPGAPPRPGVPPPLGMQGRPPMPSPPPGTPPPPPREAPKDE